MFRVIISVIISYCSIPDKTRKSESSTCGGSTRDDNSADSSPHRSVSGAEETDSEDEESTIKPRGNQ